MLEKLISILNTEAPTLYEPIQCHKAADLAFTSMKTSNLIHHKEDH